MREVSWWLRMGKDGKMVLRLYKVSRSRPRGMVGSSRRLSLGKCYPETEGKKDILKLP